MNITGIQLSISDILLALILLFVFLIWLRSNPAYIWFKRTSRKLKVAVKRWLWYE